MNATYQLPKEKVLVLRTCRPDMTAYNNFKWPESGFVEAPDFENNECCGYGLHGWLWGNGDYGHKFKEPDAKWLVVEVDAYQVIDLGGKVKFKNGVVIECGTYRQCYDLVKKWFWLTQVKTLKRSIATDDHISAWERNDKRSASATGDYGHASATGYSGHASATGKYGHASATGDYGHASATGNYGHASATGYYGHASATGKYGHASATGDYGHASATGKYGAAFVLGTNGRAKCGENGSICLTYWDGNRFRHVIGYEGEDGIEKDTWYRLDANNKIVKE